MEPDRLDVVLRSEGETNIDVWFSVTHFVAIPISFQGMEIAQLDEAEGDRVLQSLGWGTVPRYAFVTRLRDLTDPGQSGIVVAHSLRIVEHDYPFRYLMPLFVGRIPNMRMRRLIEDNPTLPWAQIERLAEQG